MIKERYSNIPLDNYSVNTSAIELKLIYQNTIQNIIAHNQQKEKEDMLKIFRVCSKLFLEIINKKYPHIDTTLIDVNTIVTYENIRECIVELNINDFFINTNNSLEDSLKKCAFVIMYLFLKHSSLKDYKELNDFIIN